MRHLAAAAVFVLTGLVIFSVIPKSQKLWWLVALVGIALAAVVLRLFDRDSAIHRRRGFLMYSLAGMWAATTAATVPAISAKIKDWADVKVEPSDVPPLFHVSIASCLIVCLVLDAKVQAVPRIGSGKAPKEKTLLSTLALSYLSRRPIDLVVKRRTSSSKGQPWRRFHLIYLFKRVVVEYSANGHDASLQFACFTAFSELHLTNIATVECIEVGANRVVAWGQNRSNDGSNQVWITLEFAGVDGHLLPQQVLVAMTVQISRQGRTGKCNSNSYVTAYSLCGDEALRLAIKSPLAQILVDAVVNRALKAEKSQTFPIA